MHYPPQALIDHPEWYIVDIRSHEERYGELGFIPGSLWLPLDHDLFHEMILHLATEHPVALVCLSGHRSELAFDALEQITPNAPVHTMDGGLLAWLAQNHPTAGLDLEHSSPMPSAEIFTQIRACFVAQLTETMLDHEEDEFENPMKLLDMSLAEIKATPETATVRQWYHVLDKLAHISKAKGTDLAVVQTHLDEFLAILPPP